jgi:hypothetical protein
MKIATVSQFKCHLFFYQQSLLPSPVLLTSAIPSEHELTPVSKKRPLVISSVSVDPTTTVIPAKRLAPSPVDSRTSLTSESSRALSETESYVINAMDLSSIGATRTPAVVIEEPSNKRRIETVSGIQSSVVSNVATNGARTSVSSSELIPSTSSNVTTQSRPVKKAKHTPSTAESDAPIVPQTVAPSVIVSRPQHASVLPLVSTGPVMDLTKQVVSNNAVTVRPSPVKTVAKVAVVNKVCSIVSTMQIWLLFILVFFIRSAAVLIR